MKWLRSSIDGRLPSNAIYVGNDSDGSSIYLGRYVCNNEHCVAKVIPSKRAAYYCYNGKEIGITNYELLVDVNNFTWKSGRDGNVPSHAISSGTTANGETIYIGRASYSGSVTPGKILKSHSCLYLPYDGREISVKNYEVLIKVQVPKPVQLYGNLGNQLRASSSNSYRWIATYSNDVIPPDAHFGGSFSDGTTVYVGRAEHVGSMHPANIIPSKRLAYISYNGNEIPKYNYEILCSGNVEWIPHYPNRSVPTNAIVCSNRENIYIGRGSYNGRLIIGKFLPNRNILLIPYNGREISLHQFDILCKA